RRRSGRISQAAAHGRAAGSLTTHLHHDTYGRTEESMSTATSARVSGVDRFFKITERGSTVGREVRGGIATFFTMAYIVVLNPIIIGTQTDGTGAFLGGGSEPRLEMVAAATAL